MKIPLRMFDLEPKPQYAFCILYLIQIGQELIQVFINSDSKVNIIYLDFAKKLELQVERKNIDTQKMNGSKLVKVKVFFLNGR